MYSNKQASDRENIVKPCPNGKCFTVKHAKTLFGDKTIF